MVEKWSISWVLTSYEKVNWAHWAKELMKLNSTWLSLSIQWVSSIIKIFVRREVMTHWNMFEQISTLQYVHIRSKETRVHHIVSSTHYSISFHSILPACLWTYIRVVHNSCFEAFKQLSLYFERCFAIIQTNHIK